MRQYHELLENILFNGDVQYEPRTEEFTLALGGAHSIYDLRQGFPIVTTKKLATRIAFEELFWKLRGERSIRSLVERGVHIWDKNAFQHYLDRHGLTEQFPKHSEAWEDESKRYMKRIEAESEFAENEGDLGPVYGYQWRHWTGKDGKETDQLTRLLRGIKEKPGSRYHLMSAWNVGDLPEMALGPCPLLHQFSVFGDNLDLHMYQRSCDVFLGVPFNITEEALLTHLVANETGLNPRKFFHTYGNVHIYLGVPPRSEFLNNQNNLEEFRERLRNVESREDYLKVREWYIESAPKEGLIKGKDHMPFVLTQLSKEPRKLPSVSIKEIPLMEIMGFHVAEVISIYDYDPHVWDAKAEMAA